MAARSKLRELRVGVIADTHGLLRPDVHRVFEGVTEILHAGDVCGNEILDELALIAPVRAVATTRLRMSTPCGAAVTSTST